MHFLTLISFRSSAWQILVHIFVGHSNNIIEPEDCRVSLIQSKLLQCANPLQDNTTHIFLRVLVYLQGITSK
jgi:hypothetical protein